MDKFLKIKSIVLSGLKNPKLVVMGYILKNYEQILVYVDNKKVDFNIYEGPDNFVLTVVLEPKSKEIQIFVVNKKERYEIVKIKNSLLKRIGNRIKSLFFPITHTLSLVLNTLKKEIVFLWKEHHFLVPPSLWKKYFLAFIHKVKVALHLVYLNPFRQKDYLKWVNNCEKKPVYQALEYQPLISILIPVYNISRYYLKECLDSILNQEYQNFEICLADDCSTNLETIQTLKEYEAKDSRIKVVYRKENGHISKATNDALKISKGEFVALMDNDDVLTPNALYEMVAVLNKNKEYDLIYSDEDKLDMNGLRCEPHFKPDYSPDSLLGGNYICHFEILRKSIMEEIGGFRTGFEGAQDHDLFLRFVEKTTPERIYHIPKILYHWRKVPGSTAETIESKEYAILNGKKAVVDALKRRKLDAEVMVPIPSTQYVVQYLYKKEPKISIIIPTKDLPRLLNRCLESIYTKTNYKNFEVIVVNNNSVLEDTFDLLETYKKKYKNFKVIDANMEFNYSKINNLAVEACSGDYLLFLNNDTYVLTADWLKIMVGYAMQSHIGAVGVKLLYADDTIQHGGVILGLGKAAAHAFAGFDKDSYGIYGRLLVPYNYSAVTAACMMVAKKKFLQVSGFDEKLKVAFNDVDFCLKLLKEGYYNIFLPQVMLYHYESKSRGLDTTTEKYKLMLKEVDYLNKRWHDVLLHDRFYNLNYSLKKPFMLDKKNGEVKQYEKESERNI